MNQQKAGFSRNRWLTLVLISAVAVCSVAFGFWVSTFSPRGLEKIYFDSCEWVEDGCALYFLNTGAEDLVINKVWINGTLLDSTEWESFPCMRFQPGDQGTVCIAASLEIFQQGTTYEFTIQTLAGNSFSYTAKPQPNQFTWMGTDELTIATLTWTGPNTGFSIKVDNTGTRDQTITQIQVNYGTTGVTQPTGLPLQLAAAGTTTLAVTFAYTNGTSYDISIVTSGGYKFTDHFTGGQDKVG